MKRHYFYYVLGMLFFTLTAADTKSEVRKTPLKIAPVKTEPDKKYIIPVSKNNEFNKAIGKQLKFSNLITQELDTLGPAINKK